MEKKYSRTETGKAVLITGAAGFIGFHLARRLLEDGTLVVGFDNLNAYYEVSLKLKRLELLQEYPRFFFCKGDLADRKALERVFEEFHPETVVNLAAQAGVRYSIDHPETYMQSNVMGFFHLLECCRSHPVKHLLFASSSSVYGLNQKTPYCETDDTDRPVSLYAATKKSNELMAHAYSKLYGIPATGLRFFTVYGPYGRPDMAYFSFARKMMNAQPIQVYNGGDLYRDFTYIDDIVHAVKAMLPSPPQPNEDGVSYKIYNISNHHPVKLDEFIRVLERALGRCAVLQYVPMQPGDVYRTYADVSGLQKDFGFQPETTLEQGLKMFATWFLDWTQREGSASEECISAQQGTVPRAPDEK